MPKVTVKHLPVSHMAEVWVGEGYLGSVDGVYKVNEWPTEYTLHNKRGYIVAVYRKEVA